MLPEVKAEVVSVKPGDVVVLTVDISNLTPKKARELVDYVDQNHPLALQARETGNFVVTTSHRVSVDVLSIDPDDMVVLYVDLAKLPANQADEYMEWSRDQFGKAVPGNQTLVVAKGNVIAVKPPGSTS